MRENWRVLRWQPDKNHLVDVLWACILLTALNYSFCMDADGWKKTKLIVAFYV